MKNKRFGGSLGDDYEISAIGFPNREKLQRKIGKEIKRKFQSKKISEIKVLEIGCGSGYTSLIILDSDKRIKITAVDNEEKMLKEGRKNLTKFIKNKRIKLIKEDALGFLKKQKANSFDVFVSAATLHNFHKNYRKKVIKEIYRILKLGGIYINSDKYALDDESKQKKLLKLVIQQFKEIYTKINRLDLVKEWEKHFLEDERKNIIMKESESINLMKKVGFKNLKIILRIEMEAVLIANK